MKEDVPGVEDFLIGIHHLKNDAAVKVRQVFAEYADVIQVALGQRKVFVPRVQMLARYVQALGVAYLNDALQVLIAVDVRDVQQLFQQRIAVKDLVQ